MVLNVQCRPLPGMPRAWRERDRDLQQTSPPSWVIMGIWDEIASCSERMCWRVSLLCLESLQRISWTRSSFQSVVWWSDLKLSGMCTFSNYMCKVLHFYFRLMPKKRKSLPQFAFAFILSSSCPLHQQLYCWCFDGMFGLILSLGRLQNNFCSRICIFSKVIACTCRSIDVLLDNQFILPGKCFLLATCAEGQVLVRNICQTLWRTCYLDMTCKQKENEDLFAQGKVLSAERAKPREKIPPATKLGFF